MGYLNLCRSCGCDFASVRALKAHRVGVHAYTYSEGLKLTPPAEDGRRCRDEAEMVEYGLELDGHGRWRFAVTEAEWQRLAGLQKAA